MSRDADHRIAAVDAYIVKAGDFARPVLAYLREVVHEGAPGVLEEMKWSRPFFVYAGVILGNMAAFKAHCSFGLWGTEIAAALREEGVAQGDAMGTFGKIASVDDLPSRLKLVGYVRVAARAIDDGERTKAWSRPRVTKPDVQVPATLAAGLKKNKAAARCFEAMSAACRRDYCQWIANAKRDATRERRAATAVAWIAEGKTRDWKYEEA